MAPRGRPPLPTSIKVARGNPGKRPLNEDEPQPDGVVGDPPDYILGDALDEWNRTAPKLEACGVLTSVDRPFLIAYCQAWARYLDAERRILKSGEVVMSPNKYPIQNPYRAIANKALEQCRAFWSEYGMTASARTRIKVTPKGQAGSKLGEFLARRKAIGQ